MGGSQLSVEFSGGGDLFFRKDNCAPIFLIVVVRVEHIPVYSG